METLRFNWTGRYSVKKGGSYEAKFTFTNEDGTGFDFTGCVGVSAISRPSDQEILATFPVTFDEPVTDGIVRVTVPWDALTSDYIEPGRYDWDLLIILENSDRWYAAEGDFMIRRSVSYAS